jgi:hypothetical protein
MAGRALTILYGLCSLPLLFAVGRRAFSTRVALAGTCLAALCPIAMTHAQLVRTDSAALAFGLLALWLCLRLEERPSLTLQLAAGAAIGLAIASRYFMLALLPVLFAIDLWHLRRAGAGTERGVSLRRAAAGLLAVVAAFALVTPYFFLDLGTALVSLRIEARASHPGADGLSPWGNLLYYLGYVTPRQLSGPVAALAGLGLVRAITWGSAGSRLVAGFVMVFLLGTSASPLHWARWMIQVLPLAALLAMAAAEATVAWLARGRPTMQGALFAVAVALLCVLPLRAFTLAALRQALPTTRLLAREWVIAQLPDGSSLVAERGAMPLLAGQHLLEDRLRRRSHGAPQRVDLGHRTIDLLLVRTLASTDRPRGLGLAEHTHAATSSDIYGRYLSDPQRFPAESAFYEALFARGRILARFDPTPTRAGPIIHVLALPLPPEDALKEPEPSAR